MQILDHDRATAAAGRGARQFCALVAAADRPDAPAVGSWRVPDVGAHLTGITAYTAMLRGVPSPARSIDAIAAWNQENVARGADLDCATLAAQVQHAYGDPAARAVFAFDRGRLAIQPPDGQRVDCRISADPAAHLLVTYGRSGPLGPALRGKITAGGRKPWLGLRPPWLFRQP
jgi:hypothetical protein